jgi:RHS repeat-associated protein
VFTEQDNWQFPSEPTESMIFTAYGLTGFEVQYWNGSSWATVPGGSVSGNNKVWRKFTFTAITTNKIRVLTNASVDGYSRITELEAWGYPASGGATIQWLVSDHLGTPRMIVDQTGTLANVKRHDYLPFGEELFAGTGGRSPSLGYTGADGVRQQFTQKERDVETGLDYFGARYYASMQGRFTGADPYDINLERQNTADPEEAEALFRDYVFQPQHWNRYAYALNNPLRYLDPDGRLEYETELLGKKIKVKISDKIDRKEQEGIKANIDKAIAKINAGADKLTSEQTKAINSMRGIEIRNDIKFSFMNTNNKVFNIKQTLAETPDVDWLAGAIIHDSFHADQARRGLSSEGDKNGLAREKEASAFAADVAERIGLDRKTVDALKKDAIEGHRAPPSSPYTRPPKKKTP